MRKTVKEAAQTSAGMSRTCSKCAYYPCGEITMKICFRAHIEGFIKGARWKREQMRLSATEKSNKQ